MQKRPEQIYIENVMEPTIKDLKEQINALLKRVIELERKKINKIWFKIREGGGIGRHKGLSFLSALKEISDVEPLKFGETFQMAIPSQALRNERRCRDLTGGT